MKFFIDTADLNEIKDLAATGMVDGVTTNPSLAAKQGMNFKELIAEVCKVVSGPVSAEVTAMAEQAGFTVLTLEKQKGFRAHLVARK